MGDLHTVFAFLHAIGKYINASGIDLCIVKANIYGEVTIEQINVGKKMKRGVEACISMYLALYRKYLDCVLSNSRDIKERLKDLVEIHANLPANQRTTDRLILDGKDAELLEEVGKYEFI